MRHRSTLISSYSSLSAITTIKYAVMGTNYFKSSLTEVVNHCVKKTSYNYRTTVVNYFPDKVVINYFILTTF